MKLPILLTLLFTASPFALAQPATSASPEINTPAPCQDCATRRKDWNAVPEQIFHLQYITQPADMNEISAMLRQVLAQDDKVFTMSDQGAILIRAIPEDLAFAQKIIADLDHPKKSWRLTYTLTEMDGDKRIGTDHYAMDVVDGQASTLKQGSRVPIATGSVQAGSAIPISTSFNYQDVGVTFDATLIAEGTGARIKSSIEQSAIVTPTANAISAPVFRDSSLKGSYLLSPNKPLILGSMDIPGSTHHLQIEVLMEPLP